MKQKTKRPKIRVRDRDGIYGEYFQFMPYDIAALQAVYGPDTDYRASDNSYLFGDTPFYTTIWDAGGVDILDFSDTGSYNVIDLTPGSHSHINFRDIDTRIAEQQAIYQGQFGTNHYDWGPMKTLCCWRRYCPSPPAPICLLPRTAGGLANKFRSMTIGKQGTDHVFY